jgi:DNA-binding NarL/FixJ family response regulator
VRGAIRFFLEARTPYRVCGDVGYGAVAIEKAKRAGCDLILLSLSMPMLTGVETASVLRGILPQAKIVGFSTASAQMLARTDFDAVLSKQDGLEKLAATLRSLLPAPAGEKPSDPQSQM